MNIITLYERYIEVASKAILGEMTTEEIRTAMSVIAQDALKAWDKAIVEGMPTTESNKFRTLADKALECV